MAGVQKKKIEEYIRNRIKWWAWSLKDPKLMPFEIENSNEPTDTDKRKIKKFQDDVIDAVLVSGGCIASMLLGEEVNDVDIYFKDAEIAKKVAQYYLSKMLAEGKLSETWQVKDIEVRPNDTGGVEIFIKSQGVTGEDVDSTTNYDYFESREPNAAGDFLTAYRKTLKEDSPAYTVAFMSSNAISLNNGIQLIFRFCGSASEIHRNFDFVHCTNYWTKDEGLVYNADALQALLEKRLVYVGSLFPVAALFRIRKFIRREFKITAGEMVKIAWDISKLNLADVAVLRQQLMGCDTAYFNQVIQTLEKGMLNGEELNRTYLFEIVNKAFNEVEDESDEVEEASEDEKHGG